MCLSAIRGSSHRATGPGARFKTCRVCDETKPLTGFSRHKSTRDGYRNDCKACVVKRTSGRDRREYNRQYRKQNRERIAEQRRQNPAVRPRDYYREYRAANLEAVQANEQRYREANRDKETERRHMRRALHGRGPPVRPHHHERPLRLLRAPRRHGGTQHPRHCWRR